MRQMLPIAGSRKQVTIGLFWRADRPADPGKVTGDAGAGVEAALAVIDRSRSGRG